MKYKLYRFLDYLRYDVPQGLRNLIVYSPQIWRTREWDYAYLYDLIVFKMKHMEHTFKTSNVTVDDEKIARQIKKAYEALNRVAEDEYPGFKKFQRLSRKAQKKFSIRHFRKDEKLKQKDLNRFTTYFNLYSRNWWN